MSDQAIPVEIARHDERITALEADVNTLASSVNKVVWTLVGFAFTVAASSLGIALTVAAA